MNTEARHATIAAFDEARSVITLRQAETGVRPKADVTKQSNPRLKRPHCSRDAMRDFATIQHETEPVEQCEFWTSVSGPSFRSKTRELLNGVPRKHLARTWAWWALNRLEGPVDKMGSRSAQHVTAGIQLMALGFGDVVLVPWSTRLSGRKTYSESTFIEGATESGSEANASLTVMRRGRKGKVRPRYWCASPIELRMQWLNLASVLLNRQLRRDLNAELEALGRFAEDDDELSVVDDWRMQTGRLEMVGET